MLINTLASLNSVMLQGMGIHFKILDKVGKTEAKKVNEKERGGEWKGKKWEGMGRQKRMLPVHSHLQKGGMKD